MYSYCAGIIRIRSTWGSYNISAISWAYVEQLRTGVPSVSKLIHGLYLAASNRENTTPEFGSDEPHSREKQGYGRHRTKVTEKQKQAAVCERGEKAWKS